MSKKTDRFVIRGLAIHSALFMIAFVPRVQAADVGDDKAAAEQNNLLVEVTHPTSSVEVGVGHVGRDSFKFGEYTGLNEKGFYGIGNIDVRGGDYYDSGSARRWSLTGRNLGLDSRELSGTFGYQGKFGLNFGYSELPKFRWDSYNTPYLGTGGSTLTLPSNWVPSGTTAGMTQLGADLHGFDVKTERTRYDIGATYLFTPEWQFKANFHREDKEGTKITGMVFGNTGGNPRAVLLPEPVDYETDQAEVTVAYYGEKGQVTLGYYGSWFNNSNGAVRFQNAYSTIGGWAAGTGYPTFGQYSLPPDNQFHQANLTAGYNITPTTRLAINASRGYATQNDTFLPYTSNPNIAITTPLPRSSLDGEVVTTTVGARLTAQPINRVDLSVAYKYDDHDDQTPQAQYIYIGGDSSTTQAAPGSASDHLRTNLPYSWTTHLVNADATYSLWRGGKIKAGYDYKHTDRTFSEVATTTENTYRVDLFQSATELLNDTMDLSGSIGYAHSFRDGSEYTDVPFLSSFSSPAYIASLGQFVFDNLPGQQKYYLANRARDSLRATLDFSPTDRISFNAQMDVNNDNYTSSRYGLTNAHGWTLNLDAGYVVSEHLSADVFYSHERMRSTEWSRSFRNSAAAAALTSTSDWSNVTTDETDTFGFGVKYTGLLKGKLALNGNFMFVRGRTAINTTVGSALSAAPLPDLKSDLDIIDISGTYRIDKRSAVRFAYLRQSLDTNDWAYDLVTPTTLANVVGTGQTPPNYTDNVFGVSYIYSFRL